MNKCVSQCSGLASSSRCTCVSAKILHDGEGQAPASLAGPHWPVPMLFPETKKETRGSPALFVSGNFQGNQPERRGCLVLHSGNSRVSLSLRAGLGQNLRRNRGTGKIPGIFQVYPGFSRYPQNTRYFAESRLILGPNQAQTRLRAREIDDFRGVSSGN